MLNAHGVEYLIVGGYAMAMHGRRRQTGDLDVWVSRSADNAARLIEVLTEFGFGGLGLSEQDFTTSDRVVQLGYPPFRIDILTSIDGVDFAPAWRARETLVHDGLELPFIGLDALKANKRASGRPRDLDDLQQLP